MDNKCPIFCAAFSITHAKTLHESIFDDFEFVENVLPLDVKPIQNQQRIARMATYHEGLFIPPDLIIIAFYIIFALISYDLLLFYNIPYYKDFVDDNISKFPKEIFLQFVKEAIVNKSHLFTYLSNLYKKYVKQLLTMWLMI